MSIEGVVRPFQLPNAVTPVRVEQPGQRNVQRVLLQFGRSGSGKTMTGSESQTTTYYADKYIVEKKAP